MIHSLDHPARRVPALVSLQRDSSGSLTRGQHGEPARCTGTAQGAACTGVDSGKWRLSVGDRMPSWLTDKVAMEALLKHFTAKPHSSRPCLHLAHLQIQPQNNLSINDRKTADCLDLICCVSQPQCCDSSFSSRLEIMRIQPHTILIQGFESKPNQTKFNPHPGQDTNSCRLPPVLHSLQ